MNFEYMTYLQYQNKSLKTQVESFKSGEKFIQMNQTFQSILSAERRENKKLRIKLAKANATIVTNRNRWFDVSLDIEKEHKRELAAKDRKIKMLEKELLKTRQEREDEKAKTKAKSLEIYDVKTQLEKQEGINAKLTSQLNKNHENSSFSSSTKPYRKKIKNSREVTGRKPGGQPGHEGHRRTKHEPTNKLLLSPPEEYLDTTRYIKTGKVITRQITNIEVNLVTDEYQAEVFKDILTGKEVHAPFPKGVVNEANYGGSVKAFAFLLTNHCHISIDKAREFLSELTDGKLNLSKGMISRLNQVFSQKTEEERKKVFHELLVSPVMNVDFTGAKVNGKKSHVLVTATPCKTMFFAREKKGHEGIKGSPVEDYLGTLIHDHDKTFYNYGRDHQECLAHILRYLLASMENEPHLTWNVKMRALLQEMIHYRNELGSSEITSAEKVKEFEEMYVELLEKAKEEYEYEPPSPYYKEGFNLYRRLEDYKDNHLLFLYDDRVSPTNNLAERHLRTIKRKMNQVMTWRSFDGLVYFCEMLGVIATWRGEGKNIYDSVAEVFN